ncbi:hypothetical protein ONZ43_g4968 [Nemania bipapillata]|uniref:Uncharacterized protein n=1 Tax=Nemania bipapillata TaxID=110536 RepID=A0ACC2IG83_9PEZI|nr:hypothetical protein ONZ43_g4968 [Nemania bipapillata]
MPQNDPGNLYLYDLRRGEDTPLDDLVKPAHVFSGHGGHKAKEFLWRTRGGVSDGIDNRDFQLVSWGEDNELRLHKAGSDILQLVGHTKGGEARKIPITRKGAAYKTYRAIDDHSPKERRTASMSDPRPNSRGSQYRRSALTLGMQTMSAHIPKPGKSSWKGQSMKARPITTKGTDRHFDQLGWMKGITMNKRKASVIGPPQRKDSKDSTMFGPSFHHGDWGDPETLQEEILRVNQQLPNIQWDNVDMESLTLRASLRGPWGKDGENVYIKVKVDVPTNYPKTKAPQFVIEKTALMAENIYKKLDWDVNQLASQFAKRSQNCLDVAFSYLLGEVDLSNSDTFFKNVRDLDDDFGGLDDESSSEEEDNDIPAGGSAAMSQDLSASTELDATLAPVNRPAVPPNPRTCGGRFSNDGRLVCFFPSKEEKARVLFTPTSGFRERPKDEPTFAGFGRLQQDSTPPRHRSLNDETSVAEDQSDSEASDDSSSSSDSETTYLNQINVWYIPGRRFRKAVNSGTYSLHSSGGGTGIGTGTSTAASKRRAMKPKNIVSIHNFAYDLPSKRELAEEYRIFGGGAEVCEHNALVAQKYGRHDLADVWRYAALLLRKDIPLELLEYEKERETILVIAKEAVGRFGGENLQSADEADSHILSGRVKWGHHPLAKHLIMDLFEYYEKLADVQMLAMLSCIFSESTAEDSVAYAESRLPQPETPLPMKAPSFSLDYFPLDASLWHSSHGHGNHKSQANSAISTPKTLHTPHIVGSYGSEELWIGEPESTSYSCGETPPTRTPKEHLSDGGPTRSLSTSPSNRLLSRANTALTSSLASFQRPFTSVASTSPQGRKRISPKDHFLATLTPSNITWGSSTMVGPTSEPPTTARNSLSDDEYRRDEAPYLVCYGISTEIENQTIFDDDGWLAVPFLEPSRNAVYVGYRYTYAEMLQMWDQPLARLEVMKFNVLKDNPLTAHSALFKGAGTEGVYSSYRSTDNLSSISHTHSTMQSHIPVGKKEQLQALILSGRGIDIRGICRVHEIHLDPIRSTHDHAMIGGGVGTCERCKRPQTQLLCVFCREPIDALYPPCLACGCTIHDACLAEWHNAEEEECPAGDECHCVSDANHGQIETFAAMMGALRQGKVRKPSEDKNETSPHGKRGAIDKNDWETVASGASLPLADGQGKPLPHDYGCSQQPISAARISLGNRLRKSAGTWGSSPSLKKKSPGGNSNLAR